MTPTVGVIMIIILAATTSLLSRGVLVVTFKRVATGQEVTNTVILSSTVVLAAKVTQYFFNHLFPNSF
jgi:hypothetical protein